MSSNSFNSGELKSRLRTDTTRSCRRKSASLRTMPIFFLITYNLFVSWNYRTAIERFVIFPHQYVTRLNSRNERRLSWWGSRREIKTRDKRINDRPDDATVIVRSIKRACIACACVCLSGDERVCYWVKNASASQVFRSIAAYGATIFRHTPGWRKSASRVSRPSASFSNTLSDY